MSKRVLAHEIDDIAKGIFNYKKPKNWVINEFNNDYGIDYHVEVFDDNGKSTSIVFYVQLKGQESIEINNDKIKFVFKTERLKDYFTKHSLPVFLMLVDTEKENIYWLFLQKYINEFLNEKHPKWITQKTVTIDIPIENLFLNNAKQIEKIAEKGIKYCSLLVNGPHTWDIKCKVCKATKDWDKQEDIIKKEYKELYNNELNLYANFHQSGNLEKSLKGFQSIFNKTKNEKENIFEHLTALIGKISHYPIATHKDKLKIIKDSSYGYKKAKKHNIRKYAIFFKAICLESHYYNYKIAIMARNDYNSTIPKKFKSHIDELLELIQSEDYEKLLIVSQEYNKCLNESFDLKEYVISIELLFKQIKMHIFSYMNEVIKFGKKETKPLKNQINSSLDLAHSMIEKMGLEIYYLTYLDIKSQALFYQDNLEYKNTLDELEKLASKEKSYFYENRAKDWKRVFSKNPIYTESINSKKDGNIDDLTDEEIDNYYRESAEKLGYDLDNKDDSASTVVNIGLKDRNPERVLKNCSNLELTFGPGGIPSKELKLPSAGGKFLFCKYGEGTFGADLDFLYGSFEECCKNCKYKNPMPDDWNWSYKWQEDRDKNKSKEFKKFIKDISKIF